jgi:hypothetical protein
MHLLNIILIAKLLDKIIQFNGANCLQILTKPSMFHNSGVVTKLDDELVFEYEESFK